MTADDQLERDVAAILGLEGVDAPPAPPPVRRRDWRGVLAAGLILFSLAGTAALLLTEARPPRSASRLPIASLDPAREPRIRVPLPAPPRPPAAAAPAVAATRERPVRRHSGAARRVRASPRRRVAPPVENAATGTAANDAPPPAAPLPGPDAMTPPSRPDAAPPAGDASR